jgi:hypothetical protein
MVQAVLGGIAGVAAGDSSVTTRCTVLEPPGRGTRVRVEVRVLGVLVSEEIGFVRIPEDGPSSVRHLNLEQAAWAYGIPAAGAVAGLLAALGSATLLVRSFEPSRKTARVLGSRGLGQSSEGIRAERGAGAIRSFLHEL